MVDNRMAHLICYHRKHFLFLIVMGSCEKQPAKTAFFCKTQIAVVDHPDHNDFGD